MNYIQEMNTTTALCYIRGDGINERIFIVLSLYLLACWLGIQIVDCLYDTQDVITCDDSAECFEKEKTTRVRPYKSPKSSEYTAPMTRSRTKAAKAEAVPGALTRRYRKEARLDAYRCPANQHIVDFLYRCRDASSNTFKRAAYERAIVAVAEYPQKISLDYPGVITRLTPGMKCRLREYLEGVDEDDIIYS